MSMSWLTGWVGYKYDWLPLCVSPQSSALFDIQRYYLLRNYALITERET